VLLDRGIRLYEQATNGLWGVGAYAGLAASTARDDPAWAKFEADLRARCRRSPPRACSSPWS
jgi:oligoendopeptidase F